MFSAGSPRGKNKGREIPRFQAEEHLEVGGHIGTFASICDVFEAGGGG